MEAPSTEIHRQYRAFMSYNTYSGIQKTVKHLEGRIFHGIQTAFEIHLRLRCLLSKGEDIDSE